MPSVTIDAALREHLGSFEQVTEIRAPEGHLLGYFVPPMSGRELSIYFRVLADYDPRELDRRLAAEKDQAVAFDKVQERFRTPGSH